MQKTKIFITLLVVLSSMSACQDQSLKNRKEVKKYLPINFDQYNVKDIHFKRVRPTYDYTTPFNIYISMKVDDSIAIQFFKSLNMVHYDPKMTSDVSDSMCLGYLKPEEIWSIKSFGFIGPYELKEKKLIWWRPDKNDLKSCYAANYFFYKGYTAGKPTLCKPKRAGRVVGQYSNGTLYILIECFMDFDDGKNGG